MDSPNGVCRWKHGPVALIRCGQYSDAKKRTSSTTDWTSRLQNGREVNSRRRAIKARARLRTVLRAKVAEARFGRSQASQRHDACSPSSKVRGDTPTPEHPESPLTERPWPISTLVVRIASRLLCLGYVPVICTEQNPPFSRSRSRIKMAGISEYGRQAQWMKLSAAMRAAASSFTP